MRVFFLQSDSLSPRLNLSCLNVFKMCWGAELDSSWRCVHLSWSTWSDAFVTGVLNIFMQMIFLMTKRQPGEQLFGWCHQREYKNSQVVQWNWNHTCEKQNMPSPKKIHLGENVLTTSWDDGMVNWCNWCWLSSRFAFLEAFFCVGVMLGNPIGTLVQVSISSHPFIYNQYCHIYL